MSKKLQKQLLVGTIWSLFGRTGYLIVSLITNIILARIIGPNAFGQIGIIMFFITFASVLTESGLGGALVRKKTVEEEDYSTVFIFNLAISITLLLLFILCSNFVAKFYDDPKLKYLLIAASFVLIINAFQIVNNVKIIRTLNYKKKSIIDFVAIIVSSIVSLILATVFNAGVWAVIGLQLTTAFLITIQLWLYLGSLKTLKFTKRSFKKLYKFGVNTTLASLINKVFENIYQLILGKYFTIDQTGFFYQAKKIQGVPVSVINSLTQGIVFATLSKVQEDEEQFAKIYSRVITLFTVAVGLICFFIFFYSKEIILLLYGNEWLGSIFYLKILIIASFFYMQEMFNRIIFKVFDRTKNILYLEICKKVVQIITIFFGIVLTRIDILLYGFLLTSVLSYFFNYYYSRKVFGGFSWFEIFTVLKVVFIVFLLIVTGRSLINAIQLKGFNSIWLFPGLIILYIGLLKIFHISNIVSDLKYLKKIIYY